jgi:hypothetical protein
MLAGKGSGWLGMEVWADAAPPNSSAAPAASCQANLVALHVGIFRP